MPHIVGIGKTGRPPSDVALAFAAEVVAQSRSLTTEHAKTLLIAAPDVAGPMPWRIAAVAIADGISNSKAFRAWLAGELEEVAK